jgi:hypothetical protein
MARAGEQFALENGVRTKMGKGRPWGREEEEEGETGKKVH